MLSRLALVLVLVIPLVALSGCEETITLDTYNQIDVDADMDMAAVESILGGAGVAQVASGVGIGASGMVEKQGGEGATQDFLWGDETKGILVKFKDGRVVHKQKYGL